MHHPSVRFGIAIPFIAWFAAGGLWLNAQIAVTTAQYGNERTGANLSETALNTFNVAPGSFGKLFSRQLDENVYALPLYVPNVAIPGQGSHNVVYVATMNNTVYAFDADDPAQSAPLWKQHVGSAPQVTGNIEPRWGILGTPVIYNNTIYFVAYVGATVDNWVLDLCALDITTGAYQYASPSQILFPFNGHLVPPTPYTIQRAGLLVANNTLYIGFANFQTRPPDLSSQEGFLYSYALNDMTQPIAQFQICTDGQGGDIWQAGRGLAADSNGNIYVNTGNGYYDGVDNFAGSVLKFGPNLNLLSWFTPANWREFYPTNAEIGDLGASGPILIPGTDYLVTGGKEGVLYLLHQSELETVQFDSFGGAVEQFHATNGCYMTDCSQSLSMAYWDASANSMLYVWDRRDVLRAFPFNGSRLRIIPSSVGTLNSEMVGGVSVSANGSAPGTGIVWAITASQPADLKIVPGTLRAYDAADVSHELWDSDMNPTQDAMGNFTKYSSAVVANGKVYVITQSAALQVYGLIANASPGLRRRPVANPVNVR